MAMDKENNSSPLIAAKNAVSATGIFAPIAAAFSVIVLQVVVVANACRTIAAGFIPKGNGIRELVESPFWKDFAESSNNFFEKMWTRFGISGWLAAGQIAHSETGKIVNNVSNPMADEQKKLLTPPEEGKSSNLNDAAQKISADFFRNDAKPSTSPAITSVTKLGDIETGLGAGTSAGGVGGAGGSGAGGGATPSGDPDKKKGKKGRGGIF
jgi:hypothetical protein